MIDTTKKIQKKQDLFIMMIAFDFIKLDFFIFKRLIGKYINNEKCTKDLYLNDKFMYTTKNVL